MVNYEEACTAWLPKRPIRSLPAGLLQLGSLSESTAPAFAAPAITAITRAGNHRQHANHYIWIGQSMPDEALPWTGMAAAPRQSHPGPQTTAVPEHGWTSRAAPGP